MGRVGRNAAGHGAPAQLALYLEQRASRRRTTGPKRVAPAEAMSWAKNRDSQRGAAAANNLILPLHPATGRSRAPLRLCPWPLTSQFTACSGFCHVA